MKNRDELASIWRHLAALSLAVSDMAQARATAIVLLRKYSAPEDDAELPYRARRALETGMIVSYMRPFTKSRGFRRVRTS